MTLEEILDACAAHFASKYPEMNFVIVGRHEGVIMHSNTPMHEDEVIHLCMSAVETEVFEKKRYLEAKKVTAEEATVDFYKYAKELESRG